jgi:hypothetical protein
LLPVIGVGDAAATEALPGSSVAGRAAAVVLAVVPLPFMNR